MNLGIGDLLYYQTHYASRKWKDYLWLVNEVKSFSPVGKAVDLGCGPGYLVEALNNSGFEATGIEGSSAGVEMAKSRNPDLDVREVYLSEKLPFQDASVNVVIIYQVIEHLEPSVQSNCISEAFRILKKGGTLLIHSPSKYNLKERLADPTHINLLAPKELATLLTSHGFHSLVELNATPLFVLGNGKLGKKVINKIFRVFKPEWLNANSSFASYK